MAILYAYEQTDFSGVNFNWWISNLEHEEFNNDTYYPGYEDEYHLITKTNDALSFYGFEFAYTDPVGKTGMENGFVQDLGQFRYDSDSQQWVEKWHWAGWNVEMEKIYDVSQTADWADDMALLKSVLMGDDSFYLSAFDDTVNGFGGDDVLVGFQGDDVLHGNAGKDRLFGNQGDDVLYGGWGSDVLRGGVGEDILIGGKGADRLYGGSQSDRLKGGLAADVLMGGNGNDFLFGEKGSDVLWGGAGDDVLRGGSGCDRISGGDGADTFVFETGDKWDIIRDFDSSEGDRIDLSGMTEVTDWADLKANHLFDFGGGDSAIYGISGDLIVLRNVDHDDLTAADFLF